MTLQKIYTLRRRELMASNCCGELCGEVVLPAVYELYCHESGETEKLCAHCMCLTVAGVIITAAVDGEGMLFLCKEE